MSQSVRRRLRPIPLHRVQIKRGLWAERTRVNREATIPHIYRKCRETGRIDVWSALVGGGEPKKRSHQFWDSDIAKWIEAAAYSLASCPDAALARRIDRLADLLAAAQMEDGYLNSHFQLTRPASRWTNLRDEHELYCAGHLMEAAVAHYEVTGTRTFLDVMCRYADHIDRTFGRGKGKKRGYPGHEEIELALVKLYRATRERRYLDLARFFIDERGREPNYFVAETRARGEEMPPWADGLACWQAHAPVREQATAEGHSVRALYLYSGMADVAAETGDTSLLRALRRLWRNIVRRRMYVTGSVGSTAHGERFTFDYDLPNETSYAETCANIALVFWAHRMLQIEDEGEYADVMELALHNGVLAGLSLDGREFFYANRHAVYPGPRGSAGGGFPAARQDWFDCACCPPNIARLLASLPQYLYSERERQINVHLYAQSTAQVMLGGEEVSVEQRTDYPWEERVRITVRPPRHLTFTLALRVPGWCRSPRLTVNGRAMGLPSITRKGYARIKRAWSPGDRVELTLPMPVERVAANPQVRADAGRVALQRGPVVYCLEEIDNGADLNDLALPRRAALKARRDGRVLGGTVAITGAARRTSSRGWRDALYRREPSKMTTARIKAIPYYQWANRRLGEMLVWVREC